MRRSKVPFGPVYFEDPSIAQVCALEYDRLWQRIADEFAAGKPFFVSRERILAEEIPDINKAFGREVASRVSRAIQHTSPEKLPKPAKRAAKACITKLYVEEMTKRDGGVGWLNRLFLKLTGYPLYF